MAPISDIRARELADQFVEKRTPSDDFKLQYDSMYRTQGKVCLRYTKVFQEPTKQNPPYLLVLVDEDERVSWGKPE